MNEIRSDDELLALLKDAFPDQSVPPDDRARKYLNDVLARDIDEPVVGPAVYRARRRRRIGTRATAVMISAISVVTIGGVAAAAVATNTLPGITRELAYDLGLPVTSPALYQARQQLSRLDSANSHHRTNVARRLGHGLLHDLAKLNRNDLDQIRDSAQRALTQSGLIQQTLKILGIAAPPRRTLAPSSSTTTTTTTTIVPLTIPGVGSILGSADTSSVGGALKVTTSTVSSILP